MIYPIQFLHQAFLIIMPGLSMATGLGGSSGRQLGQGQHGGGNRGVVIPAGGHGQHGGAVDSTASIIVAAMAIISKRTEERGTAGNNAAIVYFFYSLDPRLLSGYF